MKLVPTYRLMLFVGLIILPFTLLMLVVDAVIIPTIVLAAAILVVAIMDETGGQTHPTGFGLSARNLYTGSGT
jgi:hypothetical protein